MNFFVGLSDSYKNIEKLWTIIASFLVILFVGAIITEVIRKKQPTTYLKISPYIFTVLGGCIAFICPLILEWWLAIFIIFTIIPFIKSSQKTDLIMFNRNVLKVDENDYMYTPHLLKPRNLIITNIICYLFGYFVFYIVCVL